MRPRSSLAKGHTLVEMPFVMWTLLLGLVLPLIVLASMGMRYSFFLNAAREAVHAAAQCKSFQQDYPPDISTVNTAQQKATEAVKAFSGLTLNSVTTSILTSPIGGGSVTSQTTKLAAAADEEKNVYQIQVQLQGQIDPVLKLPSGVLGDIPGLSAPFRIQTIAKEAAENTQGLNR